MREYIKLFTKSSTNAKGASVAHRKRIVRTDSYTINIFGTKQLNL